ncbi:hypothetical protein BHYA_0238g00100 [Botrytis hyacinthi]|uniref:Uncharacterized protein n=1 Tax=Botrytis hyacinthi TaxID=278943 RepID=A0A4Z1G9S6_9HELO|nr:hypothetical protein BHYA_0238g00100 [Botrytis hyacinthi]
MDILALIQANPVVNDIYQHLAPYLMQAYPYLLRAYPLLHSTYTSLFTNLLHPLYLFTITHIMPLLLPLLEAALKVASQSPGIAVVDGGVGAAHGVWIGVLGGAGRSGGGGFAEGGGEDRGGIGGGGKVGAGCFLE